MDIVHFNDDPKIRARIGVLNATLERAIMEHNSFGPPIVSDASITYHLPANGNVYVNSILLGIPEFPETSLANEQVQASLNRDGVAAAVLALAAALRPDGLYDPADDPRPGAATLSLAALISNLSNPRLVAEGVQIALASIGEEGKK